MDTQGLLQYANQVYKATAGLMKLAPAAKLGWRPADRNNWMTLGQLLDHLSEATGLGMKGFILGQWPAMPEGETETLPAAIKMPSVSSVAEAIRRLDADRGLAAKLLTDLSQDDFRSRMVTAPWNPTPLPLWMQLLLMVEHQINHKAMLFAYLKLLGIPVHTGHLYGMA
jgi:uncharacterized damage-inducible protein DinB